MVLIHDYEKITATNILIKNTIYLSEIFRLKNIKYKNDDVVEDIYVQTPYIYLKYLPSTLDNNIESKYTLDLYLNIKKNVKKIKKNGKFRISPEEDDYDINIRNFYDFIKKIHKIIKNKLIKNNINTNLKKKIIENYIDCFKEKDPISDIYKTYIFRTKIHTVNQKPYYKLYDSNRKCLPINTLKSNKLARFILKLENIWFYDNTYGISWFVVQCEIKLPFNIDSYYFFDNNNNNNNNTNQNNNNSIIKNIAEPPQPPPQMSNMINISKLKPNTNNNTNNNTNKINFALNLTKDILLNQLNKLKKTT